MAEEKKLYPLRFIPRTTETVWGSETYQIADLASADTIVKEGWLKGNSLGDVIQTYLERLVGETSFEYYGTQFPVTVKRLDIEGKTSLRVNADDTEAADSYDTFGKTALWYVAEASENAVISLGFAEDTDPAAFYGECLGGAPDKYLNSFTPVKGDCFLVPPGTVHCAGGRLTILEIAEASDLYFRLHDWNRNLEDRDLHLEEAFPGIDFRKAGDSLEVKRDTRTPASAEAPLRLASTPWFTVSEINLTDPLHIYAERFESFLIYTCVGGKALLRVSDTDEDSPRTFEISAGDTLLIPAETEDFTLAPLDRRTVLLETVLEKREDKDPYIDDGGDHCDCGHDHCGHDHCDHHNHHHDD